MVGHLRVLLEGVVGRRRAPRLRAAAAAATRSAAGCSSRGTTRRARYPARSPASTSSSRRRRARTPDAVALVFEGRALTLPRARPAREPARPRACARSASGPTCSSASASSARSSWSSRCSASSRRAAPTCRSTRPTRASASRSCSRTRGSPVLLTERAPRRRRCPPSDARGAARSTPTRRASPAEPADAPAPARAHARAPRLRDLHLGLDGPAQGRDEQRTAASSTGCSGCSAAFGLTAADRVLQKTPFSFDVSVWELFWPLLFGARLVLAAARRAPRPGLPRGARRGARRHDAALRALDARRVRRGARGARAAARCARVIASGEALPPALVRALLRAARRRRRSTTSTARPRPRST